MNNGWQKWVIGALLGLLLGGVGSSLYGHAQAAAVEKRLKEDISEVKIELAATKAREEKSFEIIIAMSERLVRMEARQESLFQRLEDR